MKRLGFGRKYSRDLHRIEIDNPAPQVMNAASAGPMISWKFERSLDNGEPYFVGSRLDCIKGSHAVTGGSFRRSRTVREEIIFFFYLQTWMRYAKCFVSSSEICKKKNQAKRFCCAKLQITLKEIL